MLKEIWTTIINALINRWQPKPAPQPQPAPTPEPAPTPTPMPDPLKWDTRENIRHSIRVICDEVGMPVDLKNKMCATIYGESEFVLNAVCLNLSNGKALPSRYEKIAAEKQRLAQQGIKVSSIDYGLCQWNDYYHSDKISPEAAVHDPEKAVRLMAKYWMMGEQYRQWWIAYKSGRYLKYMALTQAKMA